MTENAPTQPSMTVANSSGFIAATLLALSSLTVMANATIAPSLPGLKDAFSSTAGITTLTGLVMTLPSLSVVLSALVVGALADRLDKKLLLLAGLLVYALGGASGYIADGMISLLIGRIVLGLGVSVVMIATTANIADLFQGPQRERFMGLQGAAMSAGGVVFLIVGGLLAELNWRAPFLLYLAAIPLLLAALIYLPRKPFVDTGLKPEKANLPFQALAVICLIAAFSMITFYLVPTKLPFRLRELGLTSAGLAGVAIAGVTAAGIPVALNFGRLRARFSSSHLFAFSFATMAIGYFLVGIASEPVMVFVGATISGFGLGALMPNLNIAMISKVPPQARGQAAGLLTMSVFGGQFFSPLVSGLLTDLFGLNHTFLIFALAMFIAAIALWLADKHGDQTRE